LANLWRSSQGEARIEASHSRKEIRIVIEGVQKLVVEVEDQDRALRFWTEALGFEVVQDAMYREERWLEVRTPDKNTILVLELRQGDPPTGPEELPTSNIFFYCDDLSQTYEELRTREVEFPQPPVEQSFGWWSMFQDNEGNRFALQPREGAGSDRAR
jgi:predicted enzyme related to lactoylglutathione lyase